jgi:CubicO group peptidase (beta-lactamase class C family)
MQIRKHRLLLFILLGSGIFSSCHVSRSVFRNFADITDYRIFPARTIHHASQKFEFIDGTNNLLGEKITVQPVHSNTGTLNQYIESSPTVAFIIIRNDSLLYEKYSKEYNRSSYVTTFSLAKTLVGILTGIAINEGYISGINDPVTKYIPDLKHREQFEGVTIEHLLNMTSGIKESRIPYLPGSIQLKFYYGKRLTHWVKSLKIDPEQKGKFKYSMVATTELLSLILENATGKKLSEYLEEKIWTKIGTEYNAIWNTDKKNGREKAFCCFNASPIDFAKYGRLILNNGEWNGENIVPREWLLKSFSPDTTSEKYIRAKESKRSDAYYYHWWQGAKGVKYYKAAGMFGQYVIIFPEENLILVQFSKRKGWNMAAYEWEIFYQIAAQMKQF